MTSRHLAIQVGLIVAVSLVPLAVRAEMRAIVIGIDDYEYVTPLHGAVADAQDVAQALRRVGVHDLTLILDRDATRANIEAAWQSLLDRTHPDDEIVFTYAGHGSQMPEAVAGSETDAMDEFLVLSGFDLDGPATGERLVDDVINGWFKQAEQKGARVLAAVDACHSGTAFRKLDPRIKAPTTRYVEVPINTDLLDIPLPAVSKGGLTENDLPNLTWLAAAQDDQTVPELTIPDANGRPEQRGAMSWAFARALEGAADVNRDAILTRGELYDFAEAKVREVAAARQTPNFWPLDQRDLPLAAVPPGGTVGESRPEASVRLAVYGDAELAGNLVAKLQDVDIIQDRAQADLVYDANRHEVITSLGDVTAQEVQPSDLQAVVDKERTLRRLQLSLAAGQLRTRVMPNDGTHQEGAQITVSIDGIEQPYLTLFNLAGNGAVQFLYPIEGDPPSVRVGQPFELGPIFVVPPFGADHIIAVATTRPPEALRAKLMTLDLQPAAEAIVEPVLETFAEPGTQVGIQGIFTGGR